MVKLKSAEEVKIMAEGGRILAGILSQLKKQAVVGKSLLELNREAEEKILSVDGKPSFKMVPNYHFATCLCVNGVVVHGLPTDYRLKEGDILGIDIGLFYKGFHTDTAWTILIENQTVSNPDRQKKVQFLKTGEEALERAIKVVHQGKHIGDISRVIQETVEKAGYNVVRVLVGHGIGRKLHEDPQVPGFLNRVIEKTPPLKKGMTLAIEVIYNMGNTEVVYRDDGWTIATEDGSLSGLFEKTVAVMDEGPIVLTTLA